MPVKPEEEAFLSRWSRRKQAAPDAPDAPVVEEAPATSPPGEASPGDAVADDGPTDEELLVELDLPDPDTMKADGDFSAFMQSRVPERLRRRALRTLWRSNPVLANLDELVDYGEDYTDAATVMENMQTVYEVGKGAAERWKRHVAALAAEEKAAPEPPPDPAEPPETRGQPGATPSRSPPPEPVDAPDAEVAVSQVEPPRPRHMRFDFD